MSDAIIIYYSRAGNNYVNGVIKNLPVGNTEIAAKTISEITGAELFKIEQENPYSDDYSECIEEAKLDQQRGFRPELKAYPENLDGYKTVYLGYPNYPNYWGTAPVAVFSLLERCDLSGKTIKPFCTHEGGGMGKSEQDIKKLCPNSIVKKGLAIRGANVKDAKAQISAWIDEQ